MCAGLKPDFAQMLLSIHASFKTLAIMSCHSHDIIIGPSGPCVTGKKHNIAMTEELTLTTT